MLNRVILREDEHFPPSIVCLYHQFLCLSIACLICFSYMFFLYVYLICLSYFIYGNCGTFAITRRNVFSSSTVAHFCLSVFSYSPPDQSSTSRRKRSVVQDRLEPYRRARETGSDGRGTTCGAAFPSCPISLFKGLGGFM